MKETVKLKDIADSLDVSVVTVSNALTGKKGVSNSLRNMIIDKANEMGYVSNKRESAKNSVEKIGVLVSSCYVQVGVSFYWYMYQQLVYALSKKGNVGVLEIVEEETIQDKLPRVALDEDISGIIIIGRIRDDIVTKIVEKSNIPVVLLDFYDSKYECDAVMSNNYLGTYEMTKKLVNCGHRDIAFVGSINANENIMDRYFGYRKCLEENKLKVSDDWILKDRFYPKTELGVDLPKEMPTAFVCSSDLSASILYDELIKNGYKVPDDISIVGYDNYLFGHSFYDEITTYDVDIKNMTKVAVDIILKKIKNNTRTSVVRYIDGSIVERSSVKSR